MSVQYSLTSYASKKGNTVWVLTDNRGRNMVSSTNKENVLCFINRKIQRMESWPGPTREVDTEEDEKTIERIVASRKPWQSVNFAIAKWRGLLQTRELSDYLGVSESWIRNNLKFKEWHHSYKQKGDHGKAFFYDPEDVIIQLAEDTKKFKKLLKLSYRHYAELCKLVDKTPDVNNLGWYKKVKEYLARKE